jgi:hypothetical protein
MVRFATVCIPIAQVQNLRVPLRIGLEFLERESRSRHRCTLVRSEGAEMGSATVADFRRQLRLMLSQLVTTAGHFRNMPR